MEEYRKREKVWLQGFAAFMSKLRMYVVNLALVCKHLQVLRKVVRNSTGTA